jgi:hypothetical protein
MKFAIYIFGFFRCQFGCGRFDNATLLSHKYWAFEEFPFCSKVNWAKE